MLAALINLLKKSSIQKGKLMLFLLARETSICSYQTLLSMTPSLTFISITLKKNGERRVSETSEDICSRFDNLRFISLELPQQPNSFDYGLFLLHYVELFLKQAPVNFNPFKISPSVDFRIVYDLLEAPSHEAPPVRANDDNIHKETAVNFFPEMFNNNPSTVCQTSHGDEEIKISLLPLSMTTEPCLVGPTESLKLTFEPQSFLSMQFPSFNEATFDGYKSSLAPSLERECKFNGSKEGSSKGRTQINWVERLQYEELNHASNGLSLSTVLPQLVTLMSSDGEQGTVSDHSVNDDPIPIPSSEQVTTSTQKELQHNHLIKDCDYYEKKMARKLLLRAQGWFMLMLGKLHQHGLGLTSNKDHPLKHMEHRGIFDSGCSGHMTGNRAHLEDYQELSKVGSVTFGGRSMTIYLLSVLNQANPAQGSKEVIELILMCKMRKLQLYGSINLIMALAKVNTGNTEAISPSADHEEEVFSDADDDEMPEIRIYDKSSEGIFEKASYDDEGIISDFNNLPDEVDVPTNPTLRVHNAHPQSQIRGDPNTPVQTRSSLKKITEAHALVSEHFKMEAGLKLCVDELLQFKLQHEQKDERGVVQELKLSEVYVSQPPGFVDPDHPTKVYKVVKALYGLHQAPRACIFGVYKSSREQGRHLHISDKYVAEVLKKFDLVSMIGSLMYLTASRPDIMYAVCVCSRFQVTPKTSHLNAVKRIFKYLLQGHNLGLWYPRESPLDLEAFSDSDYGGSNLDRKSTTGGCQFLGQRLISWQCKKQTIVATSTTEAEYVAAANCCGQVLWVQNQLLDYGPTLEIRHHFIRDCYEKKLISVEKIHTDLNVADLLTKPFDGPRFNYLVVSIALYEVQGLRDSGLFFAVPTQSAIASTKEDGFFEISATIDNIRKQTPYLAVSLTKKIFGNMKRGFQGAPRPLLPSMLLVATNPIAGQEHAAQAQSQPLPPPPPIPSPTPTPIPTSTSPPPIIPSPTPTPIPTSTSPPQTIPSPTPPPIPTPTSTPPPIPTPTSPPPPPPETEPPTDEHIYEEQSPVHHHFSPSQAQAPSHMPTDDLLQTVPKLISRIDSLELDLKQTKLTMGNAIVKLVKKVKKLEGFLKRRNLVLTDSEDEEPEVQGRKSQADPQDSSKQGLVTPPTTKAHASGEEQEEEISPNTLEAAKTLSKVASLKSRSIDKGRSKSVLLVKIKDKEKGGKLYACELKLQEDKGTRSYKKKLAAEA
ncbi:putative ribonuclease H-like domain-containing protein [Tanacetum coccineum]